MSNWKDSLEESKKRWDQNADFWDEKMGEHSNRFHREIIRPDTEKLLSIKENDRVLDVACGNGNFSKRLVEAGAVVTAFDYSYKMIYLAKKRYEKYLDSIDFRVIDATNYNELMELRHSGPFDKAVSNMAIMDISDIEPLLRGVYELLKGYGIFVFSIMHPCFQTPRMRQVVETEDIRGSVCVRKGIHIFDYITPHDYEGIGICGEPVPHFYYHRPLNKLLSTCFKVGFVLNGFAEPVFESVENDSRFDWCDIPPAAIFRLLKCS